MQTITLEPLKWQDDTARITIHDADSQPAVYYQVTCPKSVEAICCGRPVEELPRILPLLAPAHHLTAALALDRLFQVEPPELAQNMRSALLQAQYCSAHLHKIYFLMTSRRHPFGDEPAPVRGPAGQVVSRRMLERIMHHGALAQEAEDILGGRRDHPLTAVTGGVSRYLKEGHYARLTDICRTLLPFVRELAEFMRGEVLTDEGLLVPWSHLQIPSLAGLHVAEGDQPALSDPAGGSVQQFKTDQLNDIVALQWEAWTYQPFAYLKEKGWQGIESCQGLFHVGPLARFNAGQPAVTPIAEEERQRMIECLGAPPAHTLAAAFGALAVELVQAVELLQSLGSQEKLTGPALRTIPQSRSTSTWAALEAPQGLTWHHYEVDDDGMVQNVMVLDAHAANNALKCMLARQVVNAGLNKKEDPAAIKEKAAVALLPF